MKIYDESLEHELTDPDLTKGELEIAERLAAHHPEQQRQTHLEVMPGSVSKFAPNGLRHVVEDVPYKEAWDEYETVQRYVPYSDEKLAEIEAAKRAEEEAFKDQEEAEAAAEKAAQETLEKINRIDLHCPDDRHTDWRR